MKQGKGKVRKTLALTFLALGGPQALWAQDANTLNEVVVTANRTQETRREISSNITVLGEEDIKASTGTTVADLLVQQGFQIITTGNSSNLTIRGYGTTTMVHEDENQTLILLNGRRMGLSNLALAGLANIERIEIIRGPAAVQYGSSAMGGIVNIITKRGAAPFASLELGLGSDGLKREKLALGDSANGFDFALSAMNTKRGDVTTKEFGRWYNSSIKHNTAANLDLGYNFNKYHRVGINYNYADSDYELSSSNGVRPNTPTKAYNDPSRRNTNTALSYTGSTEDKRFDWSANYSNGRNKELTNTSASGYTATLETTAFNAQGGYNGLMASISAGVDYLEYKNSQNNQSYKSTMEDKGLYATGKLRFLDEKLIFSAGLRHDQYTNKSNEASSNTKNHTGGSLGVAYLPADWLKLRANYAEGFKMPSPRQIGGSAPYDISNTSLRPEESKTYEFGADIHWNYIASSLTWFHSDWKDKIVRNSSPMGSPRAYQWQNIKDATIAGLEASLSVDAGKAFQQRYSLKPYVNFTWLGKRKNKDYEQYKSVIYHGRPDDTLLNTPEWLVSYGVDYAHPDHRIKSRINANYYGTTLTRGYGLPGNPYIHRPTGTVVNWSLEKELADFSDNYGLLTLRTEVINLFDRKNEMYWGYPGAGRSFYVGLRYDFK
ncbi:MAG: TonB-dependent receptor [Candidatus Accumulibacter sp.]|jgi:vitamin B12 transporter|nr:TonB-dependent receptor [Accumulibacter sp.]